MRRKNVTTKWNREIRSITYIDVESGPGPIISGTQWVVNWTQYYRGIDPINIEDMGSIMTDLYEKNVESEEEGMKYILKMAQL